MITKEFTASAYILHKDSVLLIKHPKIKKWLPPGGHIEKNESPTEAVKREVKEETCLDIKLISQENIWIDRWNAKSFERPYLCLTENIPSYKERKSHQHIDFVYLAHPIGVPKPQGIHPLKWFTLDEIDTLKSDEEIFLETKEVIASFLKSAGAINL